MKALRFWIALLGLAAGLAACSSLGSDGEVAPQHIDFSTLSQDSTLLVGTWSWQRSTIYGPGPVTTTTPASSERTETLVFEADGTHEIYRDGELEQRTTYEVRRSCNDAGCWFHLLRDGREEMLWGVTANTLALSSAPVDGAEVVYAHADD
jgi:hypothetical protein